MTKGQIAKVRAMLAKAGLGEKADKEEFIRQMTAGRTTSLTACNYQETQAIIAYLEEHSPQNAFKAAASKAAEKQRNKILWLAHKMHWEHPGGKVNMKMVDDWCIKYSTFHKSFDEIEEVDLPSLVTQFTKVYQSFLYTF